MDVSQLFQLAKDNSRIAEKKFERESSKRGGIDSFDVSKDAVSKFLAKRQKEKEEKLAAENLARQQRIKARVEANTNKKKLKLQQQQQQLKQKLQAKNESNDVRFKVHNSHRTSKGDDNKPKSNLVSSVKNNSNEERDNILRTKKESKHRKEEVRTKKHDHHHSSKHKSQINNNNNNDNNKSSIPKQKKMDTKKHPANNMNFMELMKMAKTNSITALNGGDPRNISLKRSLQKDVDKQSEVTFDPDRFIKTKKVKNAPSTPPQQAHSSKSLMKHNHIKPLPSKSKFPSDKHQNISAQSRSKPKCSLIAETISTKSNTDNKYKLSKMYKQTKPASVSDTHRGGGVSVQNQSIPKKKLQQGKLKKSVRDVEDEFEREERELMRKRKLFEMRRITGNKNLTEEDLFGDDFGGEEDYDEDDDDFIDDTDDTVNASKYIREIFGYDRRRYNDSSDDDLAGMEASYSQIQKEEMRSARIAKIEDDYEAMKEEEELKRKSKKR